MPRPLVVRIAFWVAVVLAGSSALFAAVSPVTGLLHFLLLGAVAWAIRRGQPWGAVTGVCLQLVPLRVALFDGDPIRLHPIEFALALLLTLATCTALGAAALVQFQRRRDHWGPSSLAWIAVAVTLVVFLCATRRMAMPTGSMENTLLVGDSILVERVTPLLGIAPRRGDIIVFRWPPDRKQTYTKRVVGLPGDRIVLRDRRLYRNGSPVVESYVRHVSPFLDNYRDNFPAEPTMSIYQGAEEMLQRRVRNGEIIVPSGCYFVLGDNRDNSLDSRYWGFVPAANILGRPFLVYDSHDVPGQGAPTIVNVRWSRLLHRIR